MASVPDEWLQSFLALLKPVDNDYIKSHSISLVPEELKKWNEDAYLPRAVSIGPRFRVSREDLMHTKDDKIRCMMSLIHRGECEASKSLEECCKAAWEIEEEVRASYVANIEFDRDDLSAVILVDGCFLLELLMSKGLDSQFPSRLFPPGPAPEILKDKVVLSDLLLLENQIPMVVLHKLSQTLFPYEFLPDRDWNMVPPEEDISRAEQSKREERAKKINNLALSILGYSPLHLPCLESPHILDLVYFFVNRRTVESTATSSKEEDHVVVDIIDTTQTRRQQLRLKRCALRLLTAGVTIKVTLPEDKDSTGFSLVWNSFRGMLFWLCNIFLVNGKHLDLDDIPEEVEVKGLDFYIKFEKGKLEIEQLHITNTTKAIWCNLIAWEHRQSIVARSTYNHCHGKFTWAALMFNGLICSADDVQLLKDRKIVVDHLRMTNQELMEFFRKITSGVDHRVVHYSSYIQMVDDINNFSKVFVIKRIWNTVWNSFTYRQEWLFKFLNNNYNFVATVISLCTVVQTIYAIIAYQLPK